ncbi:hypothetical protein [Kitasatospora mediocidica]|uniref:hypothetical protein n=1 Tax=Kitasatospora mediocidica TaxID=58352 RepID=UPI00056D872C|nr:hypothetical protein [Kitasatospora mediocidica]
METRPAVSRSADPAHRHPAPPEPDSALPAVRSPAQRSAVPPAPPDPTPVYSALVAEWQAFGRHVPGTADDVSAFPVPEHEFFTDAPEASGYA